MARPPSWISGIIPLALLGGFLRSPCAVNGAPVLLATVSNQTVRYGDDLIESWVIHDVPTIRVLHGGEFAQARLFETFGVEVRANAPPITITASATAEVDPDFAVFARFLTDGVSGGTDGFQDLAILGRIGGEDILDVLVPRVSSLDLYGYTLDRIDRTLTIAMVTPGRDLNLDGQWTDFYVGGIYEFWGTPVPEPATIALLGAGSIFVLRRARQAENPERGPVLRRSAVSKVRG